MITLSSFVRAAFLLIALASSLVALGQSNEAYRFVPGTVAADFSTKETVVDTSGRVVSGTGGYYVKLRNYGLFMSCRGDVDVFSNSHLVCNGIRSPFSRGSYSNESKRTLVESNDDHILFLSIRDGYFRQRKRELVEMNLKSKKYRVIFRGDSISSVGYDEDFGQIHFVGDGVKRSVVRKKL